MRRIFLWISLAFLLLVLFFAGLMLVYWNQILAPRLSQESFLHAQALARTEAQRILPMLGRVQDASELKALLKQILATKDPKTGSPYFLGVALKLDEQTPAKDSSVRALRMGYLHCPHCLYAEIPLYDPGQARQLGTASFGISDRFFQQLLRDLRSGMMMEAVLGISLLLLAWLSILALVYRLQHQIERRQRVEQALQRNRQRFQRLEKNLKGYFLYSRAPDGTFHFVSDSVREVLGYGPEECEGGFLTCLAEDPENEAFKAFLQEGTLEESPTPWHVVVQDKQGKARYLECTETLVRAEGAGEVLIEGIARDISHQRAFEGELQQAKERAEQANRTKSRFLAHVSHEIRTPMNAVMGLSALALKTELTEQQRDYLEKIQSSAHSLLGIINDILDISKMEAGEMKLESRDFRLDELLDQVSDVVSLAAETKGLGLYFSVDPKVPLELRGDPLRLRQILINLINNAVKFTEEGAVNLRVRQEAGTETEIRLRFTVADTGVGIEPKQISRLFEAFTQITDSRFQEQVGTGLGLAITKHLVELMRGEIRVCSTPGQGSDFCFSVNLQPAQTALGKATAQQEQDQTRFPPGTRVLVVEDNAINQQIAREVLQQAGLQVKVAENGLEALQCLDQEHFDAVLMDVQMPVMDGYEATRRIRANPRFQSLPIIAMTAQAMSGDAERCIQEGMNDYLSKPMDPLRLLRVLHRWCSSTKKQVSDAVERRLTAPTLPELPGIDTNLALQQALYDRALMERFIQLFAQNNRDCIHRLGALLEQQRYQEGAALAHHLKKEAGNIAAGKTAAAALMLEQMLYSGGEGWEEALATLERHLNQVIAGIDAFLARDLGQKQSSAHLASVCDMTS